jgi:hypothetical protein
MEIITRVVGTAVGMFVSLSVWFLIMGYVRRKSGCRGARTAHDKDALEFMAHNCAGCQGGGSCGNRGRRGGSS